MKKKRRSLEAQYDLLERQDNDSDSDDDDEEQLNDPNN